MNSLVQEPVEAHTVKTIFDLYTSDDKEVVKAAVENKGLIVKYASLRSRSDKEIAEIAIKQDKRAKEYIASEELKKDEDVQAILNPPQES